MPAIAKQSSSIAKLLVCIFFSCGLFFLQSGVSKTNSIELLHKVGASQAESVIYQYRKLANLTWPSIPLRKLLKIRQRNSAIPTIRMRLILLGDMPKQFTSTSTQFDAPLKAAVIRFQARHGLEADGIIGEKTIAALNVSPQIRLQQLQVNSQRWETLPVKGNGSYVRINIPSYDLDVVEHGEKIMHMRVVVGRPDRPTPTLYSRVQTLVFNPEWNVPELIANKDIIPKILKDKSYLQKNKIKIYSSWENNAYHVNPARVNWSSEKKHGFKYRFIQSPGDINALGRVKFVFANHYDVYMHDTPQKELFSKVERAYSSGCIRVEKPLQLVEFFIKNDPNLSNEKVSQYLSSKKIKYIRIKNPIPLYITYITAWIDEQGVAHFREDVYKKDV